MPESIVPPPCGFSGRRGRGKPRRRPTQAAKATKEIGAGGATERVATERAGAGGATERATASGGGST